MKCPLITYCVTGNALRADKFWGNLCALPLLKILSLYAQKGKILLVQKDVYMRASQWKFVNKETLFHRRFEIHFSFNIAETQEYRNQIHLRQKKWYWLPWFESFQIQTAKENSDCILRGNLIFMSGHCKMFLNSSTEKFLEKTYMSFKNLQ